MLCHHNVNHSPAYSVSHYMNSLYPLPCINGSIVVTVKNVYFPDESNTVNALFANHPCYFIPYSLVLDLNTKILEELSLNILDMYGPIFNGPTYRHRFACRLSVYGDGNLYLLTPGGMPRLYNTDILFTIYNSCKILRGAYSKMNPDRNKHWKSVYPYIKQMQCRGEMTTYAVFQPMFEIMLSVWRKVVSIHNTPGNVFEQLNVEYGSVSYEGMLRMYNKEVGSPIKEKALSSFVNRFATIVGSKAGILTVRCLTVLGEQVQTGRQFRDLIGLKMLMIHSPKYLECDIYKLPDDILILIGSYLCSNDDIIRQMVYATDENSKG